MPSVSPAQKRLMDAAAHNPAFAKKVGVPTKVAKEFSQADKGRKFERGGEMKESKAMAKKEVGFMKKAGAPKSMIKHEKAEMMGMKVFYMDAGSGADAPIPASMIRAVRDTVEGVLFAGGGIRSAAEATQAWQAGADIVVVGNGAFANANLLAEIAAAASQFTSQASS